MTNTQTEPFIVGDGRRRLFTQRRGSFSSLSYGREEEVIQSEADVIHLEKEVINTYHNI